MTLLHLLHETLSTHDRLLTLIMDLLPLWSQKWAMVSQLLRQVNPVIQPSQLFQPLCDPPDGGAHTLSRDAQGTPSAA